MSATREHRHAGMVEDAIASIGTAITVAEHLAGTLAGNLPDDYEGPLVAGLARVREAQQALTEAVGA
jgi:hypothetical protein